MSRPFTQWLKGDYIDNWEEDVRSRKDKEAKECISQQTVDGLRITVKSFTELGTKLLKISVKQGFQSRPNGVLLFQTRDTKKGAMKTQPSMSSGPIQLHSYTSREGTKT